MHPDLFGWGSAVERERRVRIRLAVAAYAYEIADAPLMDDAKFDALSMQSDRTIRTSRYDDWWATVWTPHTGMWIRVFPGLTDVAQTYRRLMREKLSETVLSIADHQQ